MTKNQPFIGLTRTFPKSVEDYLNAHYRIKRNTDDLTFTTEQMIDFASGLDGLMVSPADKLPTEVIEGLPDSIGIIATFSVGYDHIDVVAAKKRGIIVTHTPGVLTDATADTALLLLLGAARRAVESEDMVRQDKWEGWRPTQLIGLDLAGKNLGIYGMGRIGQAVAKRGEGFGLNIHYHNRSKALGVPGSYTYHESLESLMEVSHFLSINCASTDETRGSINQKTIAKMPKDAVIVNTARGDIINDEDLINALSHGHLFAAGLDVFAGEPDLHPGYRSLKNTVLFPHIGSATQETRHKMGMMDAHNLDAFFAGKQPPNAL